MPVSRKIKEIDKESRLTKSNVNLIIPLVIIFILMVIMVLFSSQVVRRVTVNNIHEVGDDKITSVCARIENYLDTTKSVLRVTSDTVDLMIQSGTPTNTILQYILDQTAIQAQYFDDNYTGLYGYVRGEYLDGLNWAPDEGYEPTERAWYRQAIAEGGETTIVPPYVDAQTGEVVITITRMLSDGENVVAVDLMMNYIQEMTSDLQIRGKGYGFIFDEDGLIIAHGDESLKGVYLSEVAGMNDLMAQAVEVGDGYFEIDIEGEKCTAFVKTVMDQWHVVIIISNAELYAESTQQITVNGIICVVIFVLIGTFYLLGYRNERRYSERFEQLRDEEQRQAYEAQVLKFEKEAADTANKAKSDFLAQMSHEIRTPINAVIGMDEMILRESREADIREYALDIQSASKTLLSLVNGVLDFSKIESGKMEIISAKYKTVELVDSLVNMTLDRANSKNLDLILDIDPDLPKMLYGDDVRLKQVITNLLTNAVKYTEKGSVSLVLKKESTSGNKCIIYVEVKDTGIGIRKEDKEKLFESFQRLDERKNRNIEGTGLGMAIVTGILNLMGSSIEVESEYGKGSKFFFRVEQQIIDDTPIGPYDGRHSMENDVRDEDEFTIIDAHILVVDDNDMNLKVVKGLMKKFDVVPDLANSGMTAVEMIKKKHYDLILMDHMMPEMDGIETLRLIMKKSLIDETTTVVALTANAIAGAREMYIKEGFMDYLSKPIAPEELERVLVNNLPEKCIRYGSQKHNKMPPVSRAVNGTDLTTSLRLNGFNAEAALGYTMNDEDFLRELLESFVQSEPEKREQISKCYREKNWTDYQTFVHALKSSSRTIGADELSDLAKIQEDASKALDEKIINEGIEPLMKEYARIGALLRHILGIGSSAEDSSDDDDGDDEIMEFFPE